MTTATRDTQPVTDADFKSAIESATAHKTNGTPLSALLSSGIGVFALGLLTTLAAASVDVKNALVLNKGVGPLSGKTVYAIVAWFVAWGISYFLMRGKDYAARPIFIATFVLIGIGFLMTFPVFYDAFAPK